MPSASTISISDATPTSHDFAPLSVAPKQSVLVNRESTTSAGNWQMIIGLDPANNSRKTNRVNLRLNVPYEHTVDSVVRVSHVARANIDVILPEEMSLTDRGHFAAMLKNMLAHATVLGVIEDLDPLY